MMDFRPISLVSSLYKIIAKVFFVRLRGVMDKVVFKLRELLLRIDKSWMGS